MKGGAVVRSVSGGPRIVDSQPNEHLASPSGRPRSESGRWTTTRSSSAAVTTAWSPASTSPGPACAPSILERRDIVGGACVTEEFAPGYRASTGAYVLSMLRESIWRDMRLVQRGIRVDAAGPTLNVFPDGAHYYLGDDMAVTSRRPGASPTRRATRSCGSRRTSAGSPGGDPVLRAGRRPTRASGALTTSASWRSAGRIGAPTPQATCWTWRSCSRRRATQFLAERFESEHVMAALGWHAINDSVAGPSTPGTAFVLLHDHASEETGGGPRAVGVRPWRHGPCSPRRWPMRRARPGPRSGPTPR